MRLLTLLLMVDKVGKHNSPGSGSSCRIRICLFPTRPRVGRQQAADILNVSRPFVIQLIESNQIACRMVGTHRRVLFKDVLDFKIRNKQARVKILGELVAEAQEFDMAY